MYLLKVPPPPKKKKKKKKKEKSIYLSFCQSICQSSHLSFFSQVFSFLFLVYNQPLTAEYKRNHSYQTEIFIPLPPPPLSFFFSFSVFTLPSPLPPCPLSSPTPEIPNSFVSFHLTESYVGQKSFKSSQVALPYVESYYKVKT